MAAAALAGLLLAGAACDAARATEPEVKKSQSGVCHGQDSVHYARTKKFTPYDSMDDCLASGGRESRGAKKASPWRYAIATGTLLVLGVLGWLWMRPRPTTAGTQGELERRRWEGHRRE